MNLAAVMMALAGAALAMPTQKKDLLDGEVRDGICVSRSCIATSYDLLMHINESVNPCDDFYEFTCGRFLAATNIPEDKTGVGTFFDLDDEIYRKSRALLEQPPRPDDFESYELVRRYYKSCMNVRHLEEVGVQPLLDQLKDLGGWPVLMEQNQWDQSGFDIFKYLLKLNDVGLSTDMLFEIYIDLEWKNTSRRVLHLDSADFGLSKTSLANGINDSNVQVYLEFMADTAMLLGAKDEDVTMFQMEQALQFEIQLAELVVFLEEEQNASSLYTPTTIGELPRLEGFPASWTEYFNHILASADINIDDQERLLLLKPGYLEKLSEILAVTPPRIVSNYLGWRVVREMFAFLNSDARFLHQTYGKGLLGQQLMDPNWKRCVKQVGVGSYTTSNLVFAMGSMYVRRYFNKEVKEKIEDMVSYLKTAFRDEILDKVDWMDEQTRLTAKSKIDKMEAYMGYREELLDQTIVDQIHQGLEILESDYYGNTMRLKKFWKTFLNKRLREKVDKGSFIDHRYVTAVNALYFDDLNVIEFTAGILQGAFYNPDIPNYVNFGAIGDVIGHEIIHGFDDEGKERDDNGEVRNWWQNETEARFMDKADCIIDQYNKYTVEPLGMNIDGFQTQVENVADNGGIKVAYLAYKLWAEKHRPEASLPGLPYSPDQMFWIAYGRTSCEKMTNEATTKMILSDPHSHPKFRVIGSLSNNEDFAKDFNCPLGSPMNPEHKCLVW